MRIRLRQSWLYLSIQKINYSSFIQYCNTCILCMSEKKEYALFCGLCKCQERQKRIRTVLNPFPLLIPSAQVMPVGLAARCGPRVSPCTRLVGTSSRPCFLTTRTWPTKSVCGRWGETKSFYFFCVYKEKFIIHQHYSCREVPIHIVQVIFKYHPINVVCSSILCVWKNANFPWTKYLSKCSKAFVELGSSESFDNFVACLLHEVNVP